MYLKVYQTLQSEPLIYPHAEPPLPPLFQQGLLKRLPLKYFRVATAFSPKTSGHIHND
jgi:hypothetical protein